VKQIKSQKEAFKMTTSLAVYMTPVLHNDNSDTVYQRKS